MKINVKTDTRGTVFTLAEPLNFYLNNRWQTVPAGFESDGMSIPRVLWRLLDPAVSGRSITAAVIHDWLYSVKICTRAEADQELFDMLLAYDYPKWKAHLCYTGVRLFGWSHWK
ncbi:MAG: DUF1353 domain-containing protein [Victivallaceae bacterium]|nr:DUF1353 domain-containing protein [Victivallaceae bacterium]